tara:strand:+ start:272 stop:706 length:435 start_codon:yes stop_codon:yes gene_type:complete
MKNVITTVMIGAGCGLLVLGIVLMTISAAQPVQAGNGMLFSEQPVIPKLRSYKGDVFHHFAEFRVQDSSFNTVDVITLRGEPYNQLINVTHIVKVKQFEDGKETYHSSLVYIAEDHTHDGIVPFLVREEYSDIIKRIRKATELK